MCTGEGEEVFFGGVQLVVGRRPGKERAVSSLTSPASLFLPLVFFFSPCLESGRAGLVFSENLSPGDEREDEADRRRSGA